MKRNEDPSAGIVDSQSVKTTEKESLEIRMGQKKSMDGKGIVDTQDFLLDCHIGVVNLNDKTIFQTLLNKLKTCFKALKLGQIGVSKW